MDHYEAGLKADELIAKEVAGQDKMWGVANERTDKQRWSVAFGWHFAGPRADRPPSGRRGCVRVAAGHLPGRLERLPRLRLRRCEHRCRHCLLAAGSEAPDRQRCRHDAQVASADASLHGRSTGTAVPGRRRRVRWSRRRYSLTPTPRHAARRWRSRISLPRRREKRVRDCARIATRTGLVGSVLPPPTTVVRSAP